MNAFPSAFQSASRQDGISLLELMISMTIGLFLLAGLATVYVNSAQSTAELSRAAQQIENGRFAIQTIADDLRHAGYFGQYYEVPAPTAVALPAPCDYGASGAPFAGLKDAMLVPVQGYVAWDAALSTCLPAVNHKAGTDILVIRRLDTSATAAGSFEVGRVYVQTNADASDANNPSVRAATSTAGTLGSGNTFSLLDRASQPAPVRKLHVHIYFVSPCSQPAVCTGGAADDGIPTLKRLELANGGFNLVPIAEGIENLQFDYGVDADGDGGPEAPFVDDPGPPQAWANVVAVNVSLIARNLEPSGGYSDPKSYQVGEFMAWTPSGADLAYKRHGYGELVRIANVSGRRERP